jgi:gamma-glutamylcyclotransferase (GGCT)/AIG2-like uncharacterized protein YtfP
LQEQLRLGEAVTVKKHHLFDCGGYPGLVGSHDGSRIRGELYLVSDECLAMCDDVEAVDEGVYARMQIAVRPLPNGENHLNAWVYLYLRSTEGLPDCGVEWSLDRLRGQSSE